MAMIFVWCLKMVTSAGLAAIFSLVALPDFAVEHLCRGAPARLDEL